MNRGTSAGAVQDPPPPGAQHRELVEQCGHPRVLQAVAQRDGQAVPGLVVRGDVGERGVPHPGRRRVSEQQLVISRHKPTVSKPHDQIAELVLHRVPQLVHDVTIDPGRRRGQPVHPGQPRDARCLGINRVHHAGSLPADGDRGVAEPAAGRHHPEPADQHRRQVMLLLPAHRYDDAFRSPVPRIVITRETYISVVYGGPLTCAGSHAVVFESLGLDGPVRRDRSRQRRPGRARCAGRTAGGSGRGQHRSSGTSRCPAAASARPGRA
jgi:hypothetical protein